MYKRILLSLLFCLFVMRLSAAVFTVTSNADAGAGTLRDAMAKAAANGNAEKDYIYFNMPGNTVADRTITISSALAKISSDLVVDASTQPGALLSPNGAKVIIKASGPFKDPGSGQILQTICFLTDQSSAVNFEVYGLVIKNFYTQKNNDVFVGGDAVFLTGSYQTQIIGAPGKGNVFYDNGSGIEAQAVKTLKIQSNYFGIKENGIDFSDGIQQGIGVSPYTTLIVGGDTPVEGNVGFGIFTFGNLYENATVTVKNNVFNANTLYQRSAAADALAKSYNLYVSFFSNTNNNNTISPPVVSVLNNVFACRMLIRNCVGLNMTVQSNFFGTSPDKTANLPVYNTAIHATNTSGSILIGGPDNANGNVFTNEVYGNNTNPAGDGVIESDTTASIELSHNSFYCNSSPAFFYQDKIPQNKPITVTVDALTATGASGVTKLGAVVELYYSDQECTGCQPKRYIASVTANNAGQWKYTGSLEAGYGILASATLNHASSEFTNTIIYPGTVTIHDATCTNNGSITGLTIVNADSYQWVDENGKVVGTGLALTNVPAGKYKLKASQFTCTAYSPVFEIKDAPKLTITPGSGIVTADQCDQSVGSVKSVTVTGGTPPYTYTWKNSAGQTVSTQLDLLNTAAGNYQLTVTGAETCETTTVNFTVDNNNVFIAAPQANDVRACGASAMIQVINPVAGYTYRLYESVNSIHPIDEQTNGKFIITLAGSKTYYITAAVGLCESTRTVVQVTLGPHPLTVSNTFSPNGDGYNDYWHIDGIENYPEATVQVYNRNGQKIFESKQNIKPFDGNYNGQPLPVGVYYYIINLSSGCDILSGSLALLR